MRDLKKAIVPLAVCGLFITACDDASDEATATTTTITTTAAAPTSITTTTTTTVETTSVEQNGMLGTPTLDDKRQLFDHPEFVVTDVRVGTHEGYDRIVFELTGSGTPGWFAKYTDTPAQQGSGHELSYDGVIALDFRLEGILLPFELGVDVEPITADGAGAITKVVSYGSFEAQEQFVIGMKEKLPYSIQVLENPTRVVIDFQTS